MPKKRRHRRFLPILITILVLLGAAAAFFLHSDFKKDLEAYRLVEARVKEDPMTMDVTVDASYGKISLSADASVARTKKDGAPITCIDRDGAALYYADGAIYLENGKSYAVGGAFPNYAELMDETAELCRTLTVTKSVDGQEKRYTLTAEGDDASTLLRLLTSDEIANAASLSAIHVDLTAESGELIAPGTLDAIEACGWALKGPTATPIGKGFRSINVQLRQRFNTYANLRPVRTLPGVPTRFENVDLVIVRENTEDLYKGIEYMLNDEIAAALEQKDTTKVEKLTFGSVLLPRLLYQAANGEPFTVELVGLCTDICVISNALLLKAFLPETRILVDASCCAGTSPEAHRAALEAMKRCQIEIENE